ncbi:hypothetical protein ACSMX9_14950 [Streptomyces sp. LE64]|uniref:hypothetical protein n=1 Tax=Streptomyces sp. LE64 TaxID=3448653 RepID=UPI0040433F98
MAEVRNTFHGPVGSVSGDGAKVSIGNVGDGVGTVNEGGATAADSPALLDLIARLRVEIAEVRAQLPDRDADELVSAVDDLEEEARQEEPQPSRLKRFARNVRDILADAGETLAPFGTAVGIYTALGG